MEGWLRKQKQEEKYLSIWIDKFKFKYENNLDYILEKLLDKYYSDEYVSREYKIGVQPRESLLWLVWGYATKYCKRCEDKKYWNTFTSDAFYIGTYVIQIVNGQGCVIKIDKEF